MPDLYAVAGSRIFIGGILAGGDGKTLATFAGQSWTEIDGWETAGAIGDSREIISTSLINSGRVQKQGGTKNAGTMENNFAIIPADPGQTLLKTAQGTGSNYAFRIIWTTGETQYFVAMVATQTRSGGGADTVQMLAATLEINSNVVTA